MIPITKTSAQTMSAERLAQLLAKARANNPKLPSATTHATPEPVLETTINPIASAIQTIGMHGETITYNTEQETYINLATSGKSSILIGAAGTGKTTCTRGTVSALIASGIAGKLSIEGHKYLADDSPGIVAIAYTRRAVANLKRAMPDSMLANCITIHKLLEYQPIYYDIIDPTTGEPKTTMRFEATRNRNNPLPSSIHTVIIEESSMVSTMFQEELDAAMPHKPQYIYIGDIQQLPPVFGPAILGYKMLDLPTIELTQVYRQALESPIIRLAHRILSGKPIPANEYSDWETPAKLKLHPWKKKLSADIALLTAAKFFTSAISAGQFDVESDIILIPFNKAFGTDELNKHIANYLAKQGEFPMPVYEIQAGYEKRYFHIGAKVLWDKEDAVITSINHNATYYGKQPQRASTTLDYWGHNQGTPSVSEHIEEKEFSETDIDMMLEAAADFNPEDRVKAASHIITLRMLSTDDEVVIDSAADVNSLLLAYALTVHKAQGSEWRKVFLVLHQSHATMLQRELLYTAVTRAREELYVICEPDSFTKGIVSQRIKGNTLAEKAEYFKGRALLNS